MQIISVDIEESNIVGACSSKKEKSDENSFEHYEKKMKFFICCFLWILFTGYSTATAQDTLSTAVANENQNGLDVQILNAIANRLKAKLFILDAPFKRRLYLMKDGTIDIMAGLLKRPEREGYIHFIHPPYKKRSDTVFFVPKGKSFLIQTYNDLYPLRIGTILGSKYFHQFDDDKRLTKEPLPGVMGNFEKLLLGRLDTVIYPESVGIDLIHEMGIADKIEMAPYRFSKEKHVFIGISKKSYLMNKIDQIEAVIRQMIETGEIDKIIIDYYTQRNLPIPAH